MTAQHSKINWLSSSTPTAVVMAMTLLLSRGNILTTIGVGITSLVSNAGAISVLNRRRDTQLEMLKEQLLRVNTAQQLEAELPHLQANLQNLKSKHSSLEEKIQQRENELLHQTDKFCQGTVGRNKRKIYGN